MRISWSIFIIAVLFVGGCSEDSTIPGTAPFSVNLTVADPLGNPVEGLEARLHVYLPPGIMPSYGKAVTNIRFSVPKASIVSLIVYDLDGNVVKTIFVGNATAGAHEVHLANDDDGNPLVGTHLYRCEMVATVEGIEQFREDIFLTLYTSVDRDQRPVLGVTNEDGEIHFGNQTEFPYLYNPGPQMALDENGQIRGTFEFIDKVEITLIHPVLDQSLNQEVTIGQGSNAVNLVWDPKRAKKLGDSGVKQGPGGEVVGNGPNPVPADMPPLGYTLGPGYPSPFN